MGKKYYCTDCDKEYEFKRVHAKKKFLVDLGENIEIDCEMDICPVCGNGYYIDPDYKKIGEIITSERRKRELINRR